MKPLCTVDGCGRPLEDRGPAFACAAGHSFDVARSGYLNLLQPQHRRSRLAGDSKEAVAARRRLLDAGHGRALEEGLLALASGFALPPGSAVLDVGCGEGTFLAAVAARLGLQGVGVDISVPAIDAAARRHRDLRWVVANADRGLPFADGSFALALSIAGRRNAPELARVLAPQGRFLAAVPAEDDLYELREVLHGRATISDRFGPLLSELEGRLRLEERKVVRVKQALGAPALLDLLASTYRGARRSQTDAIRGLDAMEVTQSWTLARFRRA